MERRQSYLRRAFVLRCFCYKMFAKKKGRQLVKEAEVMFQERDEARQHHRLWKYDWRRLEIRLLRKHYQTTSSK